MNGAEQFIPLRTARGVVEGLNFMEQASTMLAALLQHLQSSDEKDDVGGGNASLANVHQKVEDRNNRTPEL